MVQPYLVEGLTIRDLTFQNSPAWTLCVAGPHRPSALPSWSWRTLGARFRLG